MPPRGLRVEVLGLLKTALLNSFTPTKTGRTSLSRVSSARSSSGRPNLYDTEGIDERLTTPFSFLSSFRIKFNHGASSKACGCLILDLSFVTHWPLRRVASVAVTVIHTFSQSFISSRRKYSKSRKNRKWPRPWPVVRERRRSGQRERTETRSTTRY